jgi:hypothetical protein
LQDRNPKKRPKNVSELEPINNVLGQNADWRTLQPNALRTG